LVREGEKGTQAMRGGNRKKLDRGKSFCEGGSYGAILGGKKRKLEGWN